MLLEFHLHLRVHASNLPERKYIFVRFFRRVIRILVRGAFLLCSAAVRPGATLPRCELSKCGRGPFTNDFCIEGAEWLAQKQTIVLIGCVSGTVTEDPKISIFCGRHM